MSNSNLSRSFLEILSLPSTSSGEVKEGTIKRMKDSGITCTIQDGITSINGVSINVHAALVESLKGCFAKSPEMRLTDKLKLFSLGCAEPQQAKLLSNVEPIPTILTPEEFRYKVMLEGITHNMEDIADKFIKYLSLDNKDKPKSVIEGTLGELINLAFSPEKQAIYERLLSESEKDKVLFKALFDLGFSKVSKLEDGKLSAIAELSRDSATKISAGISEIGYRVLSQLPDMGNFTMVYTLESLAKEEGK